jgi:capsular exopolysaccharide synthesis family protein
VDRVSDQILKINIPENDIGSNESYKTLRTNLLYIDDLKVITVTSSTPDEGKTITAINLAISFAQMGKKVVLLDCDLRRSTLKNYLKINDRVRGISEYLTGQSKEYVNATSIPNLFISFAGKKPPNPSELLSTEKFDKTIENLKEVFDYVIIDTPPVAVAMDSAIIGRKSDGVIFVVRNEYAKKKVIQRSKISLERNGCRLVGVVLNGVKKSQSQYGGYYGYYSKYY